MSTYQEKMGTEADRFALRRQPGWYLRKGLYGYCVGAGGHRASDVGKEVHRTVPLDGLRQDAKRRDGPHPRRVDGLVRHTGKAYGDSVQSGDEQGGNQKLV